MEAARFKKLTQSLDKQEKEIAEEVRKNPDYTEYKEEYEQYRLESLKQHQQDVRQRRDEKIELKKDIEAKVEKPSEMAQNLVEESGPEYTAGDD